MLYNILLISIDSLRADQCFGNNMTSKTPNIDLLRKNGISFTQAISSADGTGNCIGTVFSGLYPSKSGITHYTVNNTINNHLDILKNHNYRLITTAPDVSFFIKLGEYFDDANFYKYDKKEHYQGLFGGIGEHIVNKLVEIEKNQPWFYFIHLMDLHWPFVIPENFDKIEYGTNRHERMLSAIDSWIGIFLQKINLKNTLVILTSDHGEFIHIHEESYTPNVDKIFRTGKQFVPQLEPLGLKLFVFTRNIAKTLLSARVKPELNQKRALESRGTWNIYDDIINIPLIFSGINFSKQIISQLVRQVDIFPTILEILNLSCVKHTDGISLVPIIQGEKIDEIPAFIENASKDPKRLGNIIGIRSSTYKYFRARSDPHFHVSLYNLTKDPFEQNNIAEIEKDKVLEMEKLLLEITKNHEADYKLELDEAERKKVEEELRKLGYL